MVGKQAASYDKNHGDKQGNQVKLGGKQATETSKPTLVGSQSLDELQCFICAEHDPKYWAVTPCGHRVCWLCLLRLRALYEKKACPMCKQECQRVLITANPKGGYRETSHTDDQLGLHLESLAVGSAVKAVLEQRCPHCNQVFVGKPELRKHVQSAHNLFICDICLAHKKAFAHEYQLFDKAGLWKHQREGDQGKHAHPACRICGTLFYSDDELNEHCRLRHERCHLCYRAQPKAFNYHRDYVALEAHFRTSHFLCPESVCLEAKFVVFETELEYRAHVAQMHLGDKKMQRSMEKQLRRIDGSFLVQRGASPARSPERRPPNDPRPPEPTRVPDPHPAENVDTSRFLYGDAIAPLASRLQSLSIYTDRNDEVFKKIPAKSLNKFKEACSQFQQGRMKGVELITRLHELLGYGILKTVHPIMSELELDPFKKRDLDMQMVALEERLQAFPALPTTAPTEQHVVPPKASQRLHGSGGQVLQLKTAPRSTVRTPNVDFTRNPTALLGSSSSVSKKPSFGHALRVGGATSVAIADTPRAAPPVLDEEEFPSLITEARIPVVEEVVESRPEAFTLGQDDDDDVVVDRKGKGPKRKGKVVLRFG